MTKKRGLNNGPHCFIHAEVKRLESHEVTFRRPSGEADETIPFDYCIYALGATLPAPCDVWGQNDMGRGTKAGAVGWMERQSKVIKAAPRVLVVGGGALGIQFATDIKNLYPSKEVTLLHSRTRVLPRYPQDMHDAVVDALARLGVRAVLGQRVVSWPANLGFDGTEKVVRTDAGETFAADLVLPCTGTKPHSAFMAGLEPETINPANGRIAVRPTTQVKRFDVADLMEGLSVDGKEVEVADKRSDRDLDHLFAIGDCADTVAIQAGHVSYYQGVVAVKNILRLIEKESKVVSSASNSINGVNDHAGEVSGPSSIANDLLSNGSLLNGSGRHEKDEDEDALETYTPTPPMIKLTLGLVSGFVIGRGSN